MTDPQKQLRISSVSAHEPTAALNEIAELEAALSCELVRLRTKCMARTDNSTAAASVSPLLGRPLWWWRAMLISWAHAPATRRAHTHDLLRGLSCALRDFEDTHLVSYLETIEATLRNTA